MDDVRVGDVWETQKGMKVVIFHKQSTFANTFPVFDKPLEDNYPLVRGDWSVDTRRMSYTPYAKLGCYLDSISTQELDAIRSRFLVAIGEEEAKEEIQMNVSAIITEKERDFYKDAFYRLLDAMGGRK